MSYPIFLDTRFRFLQDFTIKPDNFYFVGDYGEVQGMFSSPFEAAIARILYKFGLVDNFVEEWNLHVRSNYGLRTIDFRIFYVNRYGKVCSFLLEAHPWVQADIRRCRSYMEINRKKFEGLIRPDYQGERYYFIQDEKELYKLIYFFHNHLSRVKYDKKLLKENGRNLLSFREKYLMFKKVDIEYYGFTRSDQYESLLKLVPDKVVHRSKKISELELPDFIEFFNECLSAIKNAKINNSRRNYANGYSLVVEHLKNNKAHNAFRMHRSNLRTFIYCRLWLFKELAICPRLSLRWKIKFIESIMRTLSKLIRHNYYNYLAKLTNRENKDINLDEINVRQIIIRYKNQKKKEKFKNWLIESAEEMFDMGHMSDRVLEVFREQMVHV